MLEVLVPLTFLPPEFFSFLLPLSFSNSLVLYFLELAFFEAEFQAYASTPTCKNAILGILQMQGNFGDALTSIEACDNCDNKELFSKEH